MDPKQVTTRLQVSSLPGPARSNILIVETDHAEAKRVATELEEAGFEVEIETSFADARNRLLYDRFKAILCSISDGKGLDLLTLARAYDKNMPFMLMIDEDSVDGVVEAIRLGSTQYALKPVVVSRIVDSLRDSFTKNELAVAAKRDAVIPVDNLTPALQQAYLALQPIVFIAPDNSRRVYAYEALLRTRDKVLTSPVEILRAAEQLGRVQEVGRRARDLAAQVAHGLTGDSLLFVNLHARELNDEQLYDRSTSFTKAAHRIVLEITEREDVKSVIGLDQRLLDLRIMGFRLAVDDLGAGYAGLSSFSTLEPDYVKLDMSLVRKINESVLRQRVVKSVLTLAQDLGIRVIAEGVEDELEVTCLQDLGIRFLQGYLLGKPSATGSST